MNYNDAHMAKKVLIVGGGPSGAAAGIYLRQHGLDVHLFERGDESRSKTCGEGLTPESQHVLQDLHVLKDVEAIAYRTDRVTLFDLFNQPIPIYNRYYTLERSRLDKLLRDKVSTLGGVVSHNTTITKISESKNGVSIEDTNKKKYEGDVLILATGAEVSLAKQAGFTTVTGYSAVSMRAYAKNTVGCDSLEFYLHRKLFPAYGWIFPLPNNTINIGVYTHRDTGPTRDLSKLMKIFYEVLAERFKEPLEMISPPRGWILNTGLATKNLCSDRILLCGENIACTYNFSGEGIGPALRSGYLSAQTIIEAQGTYDKGHLKTYEDAVKKDLYPMHAGYNKINKLFQNKLTFFIACFFLRYSAGVRRLTQDIVDEKVTLGEVLHKRYLWNILIQGK